MWKAKTRKLLLIALCLTFSIGLVRAVWIFPPGSTIVIPANTRIYFGVEHIATSTSACYVSAWFVSNWVNYTVDSVSSQAVYNGTKPQTVWIDGVDTPEFSGWSFSAGTVWISPVFSSCWILWGTPIYPPEPTPVYGITPEVYGYIIYGTNFSMFLASGESLGFGHDTDKWVLFTVDSGNLNSTITHTECTVRDGYLRFQAREAITISTRFSVDYVMVEGDMNASRHELGNGSTFQVYPYDTITLNWGYQEKSLLDIYAHLGLGTAGILLLILSPCYVAWHIHKHSFDDETIGCIMIAMVGFFSGLGLFFMWVIT